MKLGGGRWRGGRLPRGKTAVRSKGVGRGGGGGEGEVTIVEMEQTATHSDDAGDADYKPLEAVVNVVCGLATGPADIQYKVYKGKRRLSLARGFHAPDVDVLCDRGAARRSMRTTPAKAEEDTTSCDDIRALVQPCCEAGDMMDMACEPSTPVTANGEGAPGANDHEALERVLEAAGGEPERLSRMELQDCYKRIEELEGELKEKMIQMDNRSKSHDADMEAREVDWEMKIREVLQSCDEELQRLVSVIKEGERVAADVRSENSRLERKFRELEALASGSYADDAANPTKLEAACKNVYNATVLLGKALVEYEPPVTGCSWCESRSSCEKDCELKQADLQHIFRRISPASTPVDVNRPIQAKHAWEHWICSKLFLGFEAVSFEVYDENAMTTPLNLRTQATERFQRYLQQQDMSAADMFCRDRMFRIFCVQKYQTVFPSELVLLALHPQYSRNREIFRDTHGRFPGDERIHRQFLEVAKAGWLLHHLTFSFDPPASILRMERVTLFDERYHVPVVSDGEHHDIFHQAIAFIITPALRVGKTIIKSQVFLLEG